MGKSLSLDIRERVVALVDEGLSCKEAARRLRISAASAVRIGAGTFDALFEALGDICDLFEPQECWNFIKAAGYVAG